MKILLADDHALFSDALMHYIIHDNEENTVDIACDFYEALEFMDEGGVYDMALLDLCMPGMSGLDGLRVMHEHYPDTPLAIISGVAEPESVEMALSIGAVGYIPKTLSGKEMLKAINIIGEGKIFIPFAKDDKTLLPSYYVDAPLPHNDGGRYEGMEESQMNFAGQDNVNLTPRELDVLSYLVNGDSNKEIASALDLQVVTVKLHVRGVCQKLEAKNRTQAALRAQELGIVSR